MAHPTRLLSRKSMVEHAERNGGALTRAEAHACGMTNAAIQSEIQAGRLIGDGRALRVVGAPPTERARWLMALANAAPTCALDGASALRVFGLAHFDDSMVHLGGPKSARVLRNDWVRFHPQRRWDPANSITEDGIRVVRPDVAALNGALWLPTLRAAATLLSMAVQQGLADPSELRRMATTLPQRLRRTKDIVAVVSELDQGVESINELDFSAACRARGLPEPTRQQRLSSPSGLWYLDVEFEPYGVHVEINGIHHRIAERAHLDDLKANEVSISDGCSLRFSSLAIREEDDAVYEQLARALRARGWTPA